MRRVLCLFFATLVLLPINAAAELYPATLAQLAVRDAVLRSELRVGAASDDEVAGHVRTNIELLFDAWVGTTWGLGQPQTDTPHAGKINCGTFVGTVLRHAGFVVDHRKLQRQPSELIVRSFAARADIRRFRNTTMATFLKGVRSMGPGLFIIGLDYHVGFIAVEANGAVRFIHAGVYPGRVVDEPAENAREISESRYRVVGKILQAELLDVWAAKRVVEVRGNW